MASEPLASLDPDWQPYLGLHGSRAALHPQAGPCFICEGRYLVQEALKAGREGSLEILSLVTAPGEGEALLAQAPAGTRHLTAEPSFLTGLLGFSFHRGVLCCVKRPADPPEAVILGADRLVVLPRLDNVDNLGQILRSAAALGIDAVLAGQGPGPFERRTVRVSMGAAWRIPVLQTEQSADWLERWRQYAPGEVVGAALVDAALDANAWQPAPRTALVLGPEDMGLDAAWLARCDRHVVIPMARSMDSLNVAAAGAILMHRMATRALPSGRR